MKLIVKEIPQDSVWLDPQTEWLVRVNREPNHPGDALNEFSELTVTLEISILWKVFDIYYWKGLLFGKFNFDVLRWLRMCEFTVSMRLILLQLCLYYLHFYLLWCLSNWGFMITWKVWKFKQLLWNYFGDSGLIFVNCYIVNFFLVLLVIWIWFTNCYCATC